MKNIRKKLEYLISFFISLILIIYVVHNVDLFKVYEVLKKTNLLFYLIAFFCFYLSIFLKSYRWFILLKNINKEIPLKDSFVIYYLSMFMNSILPAKAGDFYRGYLYRKFEGRSFSQGMGTVIMERVLDIGTIFIIILLCGLFSFGHKIPRIILNSLFFLAIIILLLIIFIIIMFKIEKINFLGEKINKIFSNLKIGLKSINKENFLLIIFLSFSSWIIEGITLYFVILSIGLNLDLITSIFLELSASLLTSVPFTPSGLGFVELAMKYLLEKIYSFNTIDSLSIVILYRSISFLSIILIGGLINIVYIKILEEKKT